MTPDTSDAPATEDRTLYQVTDLDRLVAAFWECYKAAPAKSETHRFADRLMDNVIELQEDVRSGRYRQSPLLDFTICERGKTREIHAPAIRDKVLQKAVNQDVLIPCLRPYLIHDNGASLEGKGTAFTRRRHKEHLRRFMEGHDDGYILQCDISKYFASISHRVLWELVRPKIPPSMHGLVSYLIDEASDGDRGINLGSEISQTFALLYLSPVDNYVKIVRSQRHYGRYMDDFYVIGESKEELADIRDGIGDVLASLELELNERKTHITKLSHGYVFMKMKYRAQGGKISVSPVPTAITRERRRLKTYRHLLDLGEMHEHEIRGAYKSWRNAMLGDSSCKRSIESLDRLYLQLFGVSPLEEICAGKVTRESCDDVAGRHIFAIPASRPKHRAVDLIGKEKR